MTVKVVLVSSLPENCWACPVRSACPEQHTKATNPEKYIGKGRCLCRAERTQYGDWRYVKHDKPRGDKPCQESSALT